MFEIASLKECSEPINEINVCKLSGENHKECPILKNDASLDELVEEVLCCRGFLWDVLLDGKWTGCSARVVRALCATFGSDRVAEVFDN